MVRNLPLKTGIPTRDSHLPDDNVQEVPRLSKPPLTTDQHRQWNEASKLWYRRLCKILGTPQYYQEQEWKWQQSARKATHQQGRQSSPPTADLPPDWQHYPVGSQVTIVEKTTTTRVTTVQIPRFVSSGRQQPPSRGPQGRPRDARERPSSNFHG